MNIFSCSWILNYDDQKANFWFSKLIAISGTQEEAAEAYDVAAIKFRGVNAVTNFDISMYAVESIMASNTLLAGELAKRKNELESTTEKANASKEHNGSVSNWKMALYVPSPNLSATDKMSSGQQEGDVLAKMDKHITNETSLVSSLSSTREGSPDKNQGLLMPIATSPFASQFLNSSTSNMDSWISTVQVRPNVPLFAAWADAS